MGYFYAASKRNQQLELGMLLECKKAQLIRDHRNISAGMNSICTMAGSKSQWQHTLAMTAGGLQTQQPV